MKVTREEIIEAFKKQDSLMKPSSTVYESIMGLRKYHRIFFKYVMQRLDKLDKKGSEND